MWPGVFEELGCKAEMAPFLPMIQDIVGGSPSIPVVVNRPSQEPRKSVNSLPSFKTHKQEHQVSSAKSSQI